MVGCYQYHSRTNKRTNDEQGKIELLSQWTMEGWDEQYKFKYKYNHTHKSPNHLKHLAGGYLDRTIEANERACAHCILREWWSFICHCVKHTIDPHNFSTLMVGAKKGLISKLKFRDVGAIVNTCFSKSTEDFAVLLAFALPPLIWTICYMATLFFVQLILTAVWIPYYSAKKICLTSSPICPEISYKRKKSWIAAPRRILFLNKVVCFCSYQHQMCGWGWANGVYFV